MKRGENPGTPGFDSVRAERARCEDPGVPRFLRMRDVSDLAYIPRRLDTLDRDTLAALRDELRRLYNGIEYQEPIENSDDHDEWQGSLEETKECLDRVSDRLSMQGRDGQ